MCMTAGNIDSNEYIHALLIYVALSHFYITFVNLNNACIIVISLLKFEWTCFIFGSVAMPCMKYVLPRVNLRIFPPRYGLEKLGLWFGRSV